MRFIGKETLADLRRSGLDKEDARRMRLRDMSVKQVRKFTRGAFDDCTGYEIPYPGTDFSRIRFHEEQINRDGKKQRYMQRAKSGVHVYMPSIFDFAALRDSDQPTRVAVTEGEKKGVKACKVGIPCVALGGVYSYQSQRHDVKLLPELALLAPHIELEIVYDAGFVENPQVSHAAYRLASRMTDAGTRRIFFVDLPKGDKLDDFLVRMEKEGRNPKAEYERLPRREYTIRDHCEAIRTTPKLAPRERYQRLFKTIRADMRQFWRGHRVAAGDAELLYLFDKRQHKLFPFERGETGELIARFNYLYGINGSEPEWRWLHNELSSHYLRKGRRSEVHKLVAGRPGKVYIYNGNDDLYRVTASGWALEHNGYKGILFRNPGLQKVVPADAADRKAMDLLLDTPNLSQPEGCTFTPDQQRMLFEFWIWSLFFPHLMPTKPPLLFYGEAGSHKSTALRRMKQTLIGASADVSTFDPRKLDAVAVLLASEYLAALDNVDGDHPGIENLIATASTGGQHEERLLYVNGKRFSSKLDAFVAVTSREPKPFQRSDVVSRLVLLSLSAGSGFKPESRMKDETAANRPKFWAYVLHMLPKLIRALGKFEQDTVRYRMADFSMFALAIAPVIGYSRADTEAAFKAHEQYKVHFETSRSTLPDVIRAALKQHVLKDKYANDLLKIFREKEQHFPYKSATSLGMALRSKPQRKGLRLQGIVLETAKDRTNRTLYTLTLRERGK